MANLTPGAGAGLSLELDGSDLAIRVDGSKVATVPDRVARLRAAHGDKVLDRTLEVVAGQGEKELKRALGDADLLLVRSQELDAAGESGMLNAAWAQFNAVLDLLAQSRRSARPGGCSADRHRRRSWLRNPVPRPRAQSIDRSTRQAGRATSTAVAGSARARRRLRAHCACRWPRRACRATST